MGSATGTADDRDVIDVVAASRVGRASIAIVRIGVAFLWTQNVAWKVPPTFGEGSPPRGLYRFTRYAVEHEVFAPFAWLVDRLVLPNFAFFGWSVLVVEACLGAFLLVGLATRFWALVGIAQTVAITLSTLNAPNEWHWSYLLMMLVHLALFATAAGRYVGVDGVMRPSWQRGHGRLATLLRWAS